ncbi:FG-GAP repeat protein [Plantactinospora sp. B5E13]|uniref:FG-GAP repeat protein n=1 Tax=unclassified Plantactinospora TaxID=2631981 RepID=UPI00325DC855
MSVLAVLAGLTISAPARAADEVLTITREGVTLQFHRVPKASTPVTGTGVTRSDFDGDGVDDIAASGVPEYHHGLPHFPTGVTVVRYSSAPQVDYLADVLTGIGGNYFGIALAAGDFDGDGYDDLAIGDSGERHPDKQTHASGGVWVIPGSSTGLVPDSASHFSQSSPGIPGEPEEYDYFGAALATGDLNGDNRDDLAIGSYGEGIGSAAGAGSVAVLLGSATGLTTTGVQDIYQDQAAVPGASEPRDSFGYALAIGRVNNDRYADLVIAGPHENENTRADGSGTVVLMWGSAAGVSTTGVTSVDGWGIHGALDRTDNYAWSLGNDLAVGDVNGDGLGEVIAGAPRAQTPHIAGGLVAVFTGRTSGISNGAVRVINQRTSGVPGEPEEFDRFGETVAAGDVTGDGRADVLVGTPGEGLGSATSAGVVTLLKGSASGLTGTGAQSFDQNHPDIPGGAEKSDFFGSSVALLNLDGRGGLDALVAAPSEEVGGDVADQPSGALYPFYGSTNGLVPQPTSTNGLDLRTDRVWPLRYGLEIGGPQGGFAGY